VEILLTTAEVAEHLRMPEATLRYWRAVGKTGWSQGRQARPLQPHRRRGLLGQLQGDAVNPADVTTSRGRLHDSTERLRWIWEHWSELEPGFEAVLNGLDDLIEVLQPDPSSHI